ncbi:AzlC family ABC transporter permease [Desulfovibrio gilichinskyi]|uniref:4-azaleucine resistance probable transporter AzlC n=1 Tax=Desulfovibrio gilichinskyi TaxID=1519643 RepID=A0A1X7DHU6_9BACT|nr:AzlC family ABC transporter permease [Desulfovibrio gilichinskyi]SMF15303.1 4-azaleucine resistance probable transporter AzlC [Desulfovibrio gilichinskyi]
MESIMSSKKIRFNSVLMSAVKQALPIVLGFLPVGFAYGVLARKTGISIDNTILMSLLVFAGSAQFIAVGLLASGASAVSIIITTFIVNLRHLLMSAALSPHLRKWGKLELAAFSFQLTDETFAVHSTRFSNGDNCKSETYLINCIAQLAWVCGTVLGVISSSLITDIRPMGLDYALPAMFIALLIFQIKDRSHIIVGVITGLLSTALALGGAGQWNVIIATLIGASLGVVLSWIKN